MQHEKLRMRGKSSKINH